MINFVHLKNFNQLSRLLLLALSPILILLIYLTGVAIINSPVDYQQGNAVKIMYIHVPSAWMSMLIYSFLAIFNLLVLTKTVFEMPKVILFPELPSICILK